MFTLNTDMSFEAERIVCLTEEPTETLYLLGEEERIVGVSGFTVRPKRARKEKPTVSTFLEAKTEEIVALKPDLVVGFSDLQADIAQALIKEGLNVWITNQRSIAEIMSTMVQLGSMVGKREEAIQLVKTYQNQFEATQAEIKNWKHKPKVYFEEWYDPLITGIRWVSELIEMAGGEDLYSHFKAHSLAKDRIISDPQEVVDLNPDLILASWCGKMFKAKRMFARPNWQSIKAYQDEQYFEIPSSIILQPGPAALGDGFELIFKHLKNWQAKHG